MHYSGALLSKHFTSIERLSRLINPFERKIREFDADRNNDNATVESLKRQRS